MPQMPFGKHRGEDLCDIPEDYLVWVLHNCLRISSWLRGEIQEELWRRDEAEPELDYEALRLLIRAEVLAEVRAEEARRPGSLEQIKRQMLAEVLKTFETKISSWYRRLCLKYHPDRGGTHQAMVAVQEAYETLCKELGVE